MLIVTTPQLEGRPIRHYLGLVHGETILGANLFRDLLASVRDLVGGRGCWGPTRWWGCGSMWRCWVRPAEC